VGEEEVTLVVRVKRRHLAVLSRIAEECGVPTAEFVSQAIAASVEELLRPGSVDPRLALIDALRELASMHAELLSELRELVAALGRGAAPLPAQAAPEPREPRPPGAQSELPSFARDNPWIEVIAKRPRSPPA